MNAVERVKFINLLTKQETMELYHVIILTNVFTCSFVLECILHIYDTRIFKDT